MGKLFYILAGWACVGLGILGAVLPILPTTVFLILAAFLFGKGSPRARAWLIEHAHFGPPIRRWEEEGAISRRHKIMACTMMGAVFALSLILGLRPLVMIIQGLCLTGAASFILTRPAPRAEA